LRDLRPNVLIALPQGLKEKGFALDFIGSKDQHRYPWSALYFPGSRENPRSARTHDVFGSSYSGQSGQKLLTVGRMLRRKKNDCGIGTGYARLIHGSAGGLLGCPFRGRVGGLSRSRMNHAWTIGNLRQSGQAKGRDDLSHTRRFLIEESS
jgi:hypothetical protein